MSGVIGSEEPARTLDSVIRGRADRPAILSLALPLMGNGGIQIVLNLTDMWFIGRISTQALAAVGSVQLLIVVIVMILGGAAASVQTVVAQSHGARLYSRASQAAWMGIWAALCMIPVFFAVAASGRFILAPLGLDAQTEHIAVDFWFPRVIGTSFGVAVSGMLGFFNGIAFPRATVWISAAIAAVNVLFNQLFVVEMNWGVAGSGWATTAAQATGLVIAVGVMLSSVGRCPYKAHLTWRPRPGRIWRQMKLGFPMGLLPAADVLGFSIFQMMQVRAGAVCGAATQLVAVLTSISYICGFGIASAGTTLVGQAVGARDRGRAREVGSTVISWSALSMGGIGLLLALTGPWLLPMFAAAHDEGAAAAVQLGTQLLWIAAGYQFFDGLNLGSGMCLVGAGDARLPAALAIALSWLVLLPLAHSLTFAPGEGWIRVLPQFGLGAVGGWSAVLTYMVLLGVALFLRWRRVSHAIVR